MPGSQLGKICKGGKYAPPGIQRDKKFGMRFASPIFKKETPKCYTSYFVLNQYCESHAYDPHSRSLILTHKSQIGGKLRKKSK